jgi:hypothetical protein
MDEDSETVPWSSIGPKALQRTRDCGHPITVVLPAPHEVLVHAGCWARRVLLMNKYTSLTLPLYTVDPSIQLTMVGLPGYRVQGFGNSLSQFRPGAHTGPWGESRGSPQESTDWLQGTQTSRPTGQRLWGVIRVWTPWDQSARRYMGSEWGNARPTGLSSGRK